jgi:hypothetical protein
LPYGARQDPHAPEAIDLVRHADDAAAMGARLTNRHLSFLRQRKLEPVIVTLNEQSSTWLRYSGAQGETIAVCTGMSPKLWSVRVDPSEIENAVLNLSINARNAPRGVNSLSKPTT